MNKYFFLLLSCIVAQGAANAMQQFPLHRAVKEGDIELVQALIFFNNGATINQYDGDGWAPLHCAADNGNEAIVLLLLDNGADANLRLLDDWTPLHFAAYGGHEEIVLLLLDRGANVNLKGKDGRTPLYVAAARGHEAIARLLLDLGADVNLKNNVGWIEGCFKKKHKK